MYGIIKAPIARLSKEQTQNCELHDEVLYGTLVEISKEFNRYYQIKTYYQYEGMVQKKDIHLLSSEINFDETYNAMIVKPFVDVLAEPKYQSYPLISIPKGSYINIVDEETPENWTKVLLVDHRIGYIRSDSFKYRKKFDLMNDEDEIRSNVVKNALSYIGAQYRWGGKTVLGIDCSGLCSISYLLEGITIYRDAKLNEQIVETFKMKEITKDSLKPGDLIYSPGHIMMYIGNQKFVHSSGSLGGVRINSFNPNDVDYSKKHAQSFTGYASIFK